MKSSISVRTHIARDFLQSAALFKTDKLVVWEYVSNGLQYVDPGTAPEVRVILDSKRRTIMVADNGRGMDREGLQNFFLMHGENLDRKAGRRGRGRFGTGKSAAFGIAECLQVRTVRNKLRNTVQLSRADLQGASEIPVRELEIDCHTEEGNGTTIEIRDVMLSRLDPQGVIRFVERHLAHWPNKPLVIVNGHVCEYSEPPIAWEEKISSDAEVSHQLGQVELFIRASKSPLEPEQQGITISANGVWLETTLAGAECQPMSQYIYGEIDVPRLDEDATPIAAYDMSRSMQLNRSNPIVFVLLSFIGREVDRVRRRLVKEEQSRRSMEELKKLAREADLIARMINEDFCEYSNRVARVRAKSGLGRDAGNFTQGSGTGEDELILGSRIPARVVEDYGDSARGTSGGGDKPSKAGPVLAPDESGAKRGDPADGNGKYHRPRGGFNVEFRAMGIEELRAKYARDERTILVNLDHPQIAAAKGSGSTEDPMFRRLAYEVAFAEYAIALASELAAQDEYIEPSDPIFDIRDTLNRMGKRAAALYRS